MGVLAGRAAVERATGPVERHANACEPIGQHIVRERHDFVSRGMNIAMHVANEMTDPRSLGEIARMYHQDVLVGGSDDVGRFCVVMKKLTRMKDRSSRQLEREHDAVRRFNEAAHAPAIDRAHWQLNYRQPRRWLGVRMKHPHRNRSHGCHCMQGTRQKAKGKRESAGEQ